MLPSKRQITLTNFTSPVCTTSGSVGTHELPLPPHSPPPSWLPLYFFEKMRYTRKRHLWRCSQALRRGACKPLIPVFNSGHRLQPSNSCMAGVFLMPARKNGRILMRSEYARLCSLLESQCCHSTSVSRIATPSGQDHIYSFCSALGRTQARSPLP